VNEAFAVKNRVIMERATNTYELFLLRSWRKTIMPRLKVARSDEYGAGAHIG